MCVKLLLAPNGLVLSHAALLDREGTRAETSFQNRGGLVAASGVGWSTGLGGLSPADGVQCASA
jgi:hypothetical protein